MGKKKSVVEFAARIEGFHVRSFWKFLGKVFIKQHLDTMTTNSFLECECSRDLMVDSTVVRETATRMKLGSSRRMSCRNR